MKWTPTLTMSHQLPTGWFSFSLPPFSLLNSNPFASFFTRWLFEHEVLEYVFGPGVHLELLRRSTDIAKFLAKHKKLTSTHIDLMWRLFEDVCSHLKFSFSQKNKTNKKTKTKQITPLAKFGQQQNQHRSVVHGVLSLFGDLVHSLSLDIISYIFQKVQAVPFNQFDYQTLLFVQKLTTAATMATEAFLSFSFLIFFHRNVVFFFPIIFQNRKVGAVVPRYGADIFWALTREESPVSIEVAQQAFNMLLQFIAWTSHVDRKCVPSHP